MNVKLLRKIQKHILAEPKRYWQNNWILRGESIAMRDLPMPPCGTVGCIAGWACELNGKKNITDYRSNAARLLELEPLSAQRLFAPVLYDAACRGVYDWPDKFQKAYAKAKTPAGRARAAARRIDHFIKTKGAE